MLEAYKAHVAERTELGIVPRPLSAEQVADVVELLKNPPSGEEQFILDLISNRVPPGVDEAAYIKAGFLSAVAKGESSICTATRPKSLPGDMLSVTIPSESRTSSVRL